jgi:preprotein translocase subunit SecG
MENKQSPNLIEEQFTKGAGSNITGLKIKVSNFLKRREVVLFLLFFIVSSLSFGLGYLYSNDQNLAPIIIQN